VAVFNLTSLHFEVLPCAEFGELPKYKSSHWPKLTRLGVLVFLGLLIQAASREGLIIAMTTSRSLRVGISFFSAQCLRENLIVDLLTYFTFILLRCVARD